MPDKVVGPVEVIPGRFGQNVAFYALRFDKLGKCISPLSREHLINHIANDGVTDVIIYSHGWNNDFPTAKNRYEEFLKGISESAAAHGGHIPQGFKPVFVGIFWPSTILVWPSEQAPDIASSFEDENAFEEALNLLDAATRTRLKEMLKNDEALDADELKDLARQFSENLPPSDPADGDSEPYSADDLLAIWKGIVAESAPETPPSGSFGDFGGSPSPTRDDADVAGFFDFDPRIVLRATTMLKMKDRAGVVGAKGVADTVRLILGKTRAQLHLVGHSYGAKVVTAALVHSDPSRKAKSLLLLQPAINHLVFAPDAHNGKPGSFRTAFDLCARPIMATHSRNDVPLFRIFHLLARRKSDLGEAQVAAGRASRFAALGGYGPQEFAPGEVSKLNIRSIGAAYPTPVPSVRLIGLNGAIGISGHSDVSNPFTYWAALNLLS